MDACYFPSFFFFNDTATTEIYTLSLHDALPIYGRKASRRCNRCRTPVATFSLERRYVRRSEEHTSELQSHSDLVCRLLLEKKKKKKRKKKKQNKKKQKKKKKKKKTKK